MPQRAHTFQVNCCLKVHNAHLKTTITNFGIRFCSIRLIHLIGRKSVHLETKTRLRQWYLRELLNTD